MAQGKHRISKEKADKLLAGMKTRISDSDSPFKDFPEGFIFDIEAVRKLVSHPEAAHFIIRFGWKEDEKVIAPILCVADADKEVLEQGGRRKASSNTRSLMMDSPDEPGKDEEEGGFLDEGTRHP
jgi:hypothetical protein